MSPTRTTPKRSLAIGSAFAVAVALGLAGCGEYSPVAPEKEQPPATQRDTGSRDGADPTDPAVPEVPDSIPDAAPPATPPGTDTPPPGSGGGATPRNRQGGGSGGSSGSSGLGDSGGTGSNGGNGGQPPPAVYSWSLPKTDTSPNDFQDGPAYARLLAADCDGAASFLEPSEFTNNPAFGVFKMKTPRYVVLLSAGIAMCRSEFDAARVSYQYAMNQWGTQGLDHPSHPAAENGGGNPVTPPWRRGYREPECDLYRALTFSLTGVPADSLQCPGGLRPVHHYVAYTLTELKDPTQPEGPENPRMTVVVWDNPLTSTVDESLDPPRNWNTQPGVKGTSPEVGENNTGDPDDEFDEPVDPFAAAEATAEVTSLKAADVAEARVPAAATEPQGEAVATEPAADQPAAAEPAADEPAPVGAEPAPQPEGAASVPAGEPPASTDEPAAPPVAEEPSAAPPAESALPAPAVP